MVEPAAPLVKAEDMAKKYGDFIALHPLNVEVHSGEFFGVFGPNGAGKSTFIKLLTGQLRPSKGRIEILGVDAVLDPQKVKANIGIVPESESPPSFLTPQSGCEGETKEVPSKLIIQGDFLVSMPSPSPGVSL